MKLELFTIYSINGHLAIKLADLAKIVNYSDSFLLKYLKKLLKKGIRVAYKWKRDWYILLPKTPITKTTPISELFGQNNNQTPNIKPDVNITFPNGTVASFNWADVLNNSPLIIVTFFLKSAFNLIARKGRLYIAGTVSYPVDSSTLSAKSTDQFVPLNLADFPATTDYKYGYYIFYNEARMSVFDPGTSGTLKSIQLPAAFFELCRELDAKENARNGANPGLPARTNLSTTISFDTGTISVAATLPVTPSLDANGSVVLSAVDYLGGTYSAFENGGGDLTSDTIQEAFLEMASLLAAAEKAVTPVDNQPNNIQVQFDLETGTATISANLPFTTAAADDGAVTIIAIDYL